MNLGQCHCTIALRESYRNIGKSKATNNIQQGLPFKTMTKLSAEQLFDLLFEEDALVNKSSREHQGLQLKRLQNPF